MIIGYCLCEEAANPNLNIEKHDEEVIFVHLIPHSHNDAGWNKPYEDYYSWAVERILTSMVAFLRTHETATFNWADISFLN